MYNREPSRSSRAPGDHHLVISASACSMLAAGCAARAFPKRQKMSAFTTANCAFPKCAHCGSSVVTLKPCSRCKVAKYCGRTCQVAHWKQHKSLCNIITVNFAQNESDCRKVAKLYRKLNAEMGDGDLIVCPIETHVGVVGYPGFPIPSGVPPNFVAMQKSLIEHRRRSSQHTVFYGEDSFKAYYDELVDNQPIWMAFFHNPLNYNSVDHTVVILGCLATLYRQRGTYEECCKVLDLNGIVIQIYKQHCSVPGTLLVHLFDNCEEHEHQMHVTRFNLNFHLKNYIANIPVYKDLCIYEAKHNAEKSNMLYILQHLGAINQRRPSVKDIRALPDKAVLEAMKFNDVEHPSHQKHIANDKQRTKLMVCGNCNKQEAALGKFKTCSRCDEVAYCGGKCQKSAWRAHKKICSKKK